MTGIKMQDDDLDQLFAAARGRVPPPSEALLARVLTDALHAQPTVTQPIRAAQRPGLWAGLSAQVGGLPTVAGLCSAAIIGVVVGYADPTTLDYLTTGSAADPLDGMDLFPTTDLITTEG
jgi:hypothetical protein